jgi:hypothetical protein
MAILNPKAIAYMGKTTGITGRYGDKKVKNNRSA